MTWDVLQTVLVVQQRLDSWLRELLDHGDCSCNSRLLPRYPAPPPEGLMDGRGTETRPRCISQ